HEQNKIIVVLLRVKQSNITIRLLLDEFNTEQFNTPIHVPVQQHNVNIYICLSILQLDLPTTSQSTLHLERRQHLHKRHYQQLPLGQPIQLLNLRLPLKLRPIRSFLTLLLQLNFQHHNIQPRSSSQ
ncbi:hypothetical protein D6C91_07579, partial [Aureobasidium pullulans]